MFLRSLKLFSHDAMFYGLSNVISKLIGFLLIPIYTIYLSPADYGVMTLLGFYTLLYNPLSHLGLQGAMFRYVGFAKSTEEEDTILSSAFKTNILISIFFTLVAIFLIIPIELFLLKSTNYTNLLYLTIIASFFSSISQMVYSFLRIKSPLHGANPSPYKYIRLPILT